MNDALKARPIEILLIEDNPGDIILTKDAFKQAKISNNLYIAEDGEKALQLLRREGEYANQPKPDLILLDLNLPKVDGKEVLQAVKNSDELKSIPIVVLSSSKAGQDINESYNLHANCYITKPIDMEKLAHIVKSLENFWFSVVTLPVDTE